MVPQKLCKAKEELLRDLHELIDNITNSLKDILNISEDSVITLKKVNLKIEFTRDLTSLFGGLFGQINSKMWDIFNSSNHLLFDRITSHYKTEDKHIAEEFNYNRWERERSRPFFIVPRKNRFSFIKGIEEFERLFKEGILSIPAVRAQQKRHYLDNDSFGRLLTDFNLKKKKFSS